MNKYKKIIDQVRAKGDKKAQEKETDAIVDVMCLSIDDSPHMIALEDGAAILASLYTLCMDDGINTIGAYLEIKERMDYLISSMHDKMREKYPVPARAKSEGQSEPDIADALERLRSISAEEDRS